MTIESVVYRPTGLIGNEKFNQNSPKGLHIKAQGCGIPLPWVNVRLLHVLP